MTSASVHPMSAAAISPGRQALAASTAAPNFAEEGKGQGLPKGEKLERRDQFLMGKRQRWQNRSPDGAAAQAANAWLAIALRGREVRVMTGR